MIPASPNEQSLPVTLKLRILGESVEVSAEVPPGSVRLDQVLSLLRQIDNAAIDRAVQQSQDASRPISCCRGCDACCRAQPVPITPSEAYALWLLVENLPESRQSTLKATFADRSRRLHEADLAQIYLDRAPNLSADEARSVVRRYFSLGLFKGTLSRKLANLFRTSRKLAEQLPRLTSDALIAYERIGEWGQAYSRRVDGRMAAHVRSLPLHHPISAQNDKTSWIQRSHTPAHLPIYTSFPSSAS